MQKLPDLPKRALTPEQREHLVERQRIQAAQAAAAAKTAEAHEFADGVERRRLQAAAAGRDRARVSLPMDY
jgi:hypothetical protein